LKERQRGVLDNFLDNEYSFLSDEKPDGGSSSQQQDIPLEFYGREDSLALPGSSQLPQSPLVDNKYEPVIRDSKDRAKEETAEKMADEFERRLKESKR
jgi:hypothetical protein